jgi:hypothetical protein
MSHTPEKRSEAGQDEFAAGSMEKHYSIQDLGKLWQLSPQTIRRLFRNEPEVIEIGTAVARRKRRYVTLRIPESVALRVHQRLRKAG